MFKSTRQDGAPGPWSNGYQCEMRIPRLELIHSVFQPDHGCTDLGQVGYKFKPQWPPPRLATRY